MNRIILLKKLYLLAALIVATAGAGFAQDGWIERNADIGDDLVSVVFTSSDRGWIAGDNGYLAATVDGGESWTRFPLNTTEDINEIYFRNQKEGYLVAGRLLFVTNDGGNSWHQSRIYRTGEFGAGRPEFLSIRFSDKKRGYIIGSVLRSSGEDDIVVDSLLMRTEDGGGTWRRVAVPTKVELFHLDFPSSSRGWIVGDKGAILSTTDEGRTWTLQRSNTDVPLFSVDFRDSRNGVAVGRAGTILRTTNGGVAWERIRTNFTDTLMRVRFADDRNGWIAGHSGVILRTEDKGLTWVRQESNKSGHFYGLFIDKKGGCVVGAEGAILHFKK